MADSVEMESSEEFTMIEENKLDAMFDIPTDEPAGIFPPYTQPSPQYMQQSEMLGPTAMDGMSF